MIKKRYVDEDGNVIDASKIVKSVPKDWKPPVPVQEKPKENDVQTAIRLLTLSNVAASEKQEDMLKEISSLISKLNVEETKKFHIKVKRDKNKLIESLEVVKA